MGAVGGKEEEEASGLVRTMVQREKHLSPQPQKGHKSDVSLWGDA